MFVPSLCSVSRWYVLRSPVFADAIRSPNANFLGTFTCDNGQSLTIVSPSDPTPIGQVIGTNQVVIVTGYRDTGTAGGVPYDITISFAGGHGEAKGLKTNTVSCSQAYQFEHPQFGVITGNTTLVGFLTPRRG